MKFLKMYKLAGIGRQKEKRIVVLLFSSGEILIQ